MHMSCQNLVEQSKPHTRLGSVDYAAPELVIADGLKPYDAFAIDVWAMGICLFTLLYAYKPFADMDDMDKTDSARVDNTCERIKAGKLKIPDHQYDHSFNNVQISEDCLDLLHRLLEYNPQKRITIAGIPPPITSSVRLSPRCDSRDHASPMVPRKTA